MVRSVKQGLPLKHTRQEVVKLFNNNDEDSNDKKKQNYLDDDVKYCPEWTTLSWHNLYAEAPHDPRNETQIATVMRITLIIHLQVPLQYVNTSRGQPLIKDCVAETFTNVTIK